MSNRCWSGFLRRAKTAIVAASIVLMAFEADANEAPTPRGGIAEIRITGTQPVFSGASFGAVGAYEILSGKAYGTLDPRAPANAGLTNLRYVPLNAEGLINYSMDIAILRPVNAGAGNGRIFFEIINRGGPQSFGILNKGSLTNPGNGFLMKQGYAIVLSGWQPEANPATAAYKAYFPIATKGTQPITETVMEVYVPDTPETGAGNTHMVTSNVLNSNLTYPPYPPAIAPVSSPAGATLTVRQHYDDARIPLSISAVTFTSPTRVAIDLTEGKSKGMDAGAIYELVYQAENPYVGGVGFASVRDLISYLRNQTVDSAGNDNPARPNGMPIAAAYGWGRSQSGRFLKQFIYAGFNEDLSGRMVFDGGFALVSGARMTDHNVPFAQTSRWIRQHEERDYAGTEFPFTYQTVYDPRTGKTDGILNRCSATRTCPKIFHIDSDYESWHGHISLVVTDPEGHELRKPEGFASGSERRLDSAVHDNNGVALPDNVRAYQLSGQAHGAGNGTPSATPVTNCKLASNPLDDSAVDRALVVAMDEWVTGGATPPASEYPNLAAKTLQTLEEQAAMWPTIPGFPFNRRIAMAQVANYGTVPPSYGATYPIYVPKTDPVIGNPRGGVIGPDLAAPLGTYMGRNFRAPGHAEDELCAGNSGFIPFAATKAARLASGDSRPSLEELYPGGATQFYAQRRAQIEALIAKRLALPSELDSWTNEVRFP
jgi:hypothetical protein